MSEKIGVTGLRGDREININGNKIELPQPLSDYVIVGGIVIVLLKWGEAKDELAARNVFAFDSDGNEVWQIERAGEGVWPYTVFREKDGDRYVKNFDGVLFELDPETGEIEFHERVDK